MKMVERFIEVVPFVGLADIGKLGRIVEDILLSSDLEKIIFLHEDKGFLAATKNEFPYGFAQVAVELGWWVEPEYRKSSVGKDLKEAFEYWATQIGCKGMIMTSFTEQVDKYLSKDGYVPYERTYYKELKWDS